MPPGEGFRDRFLRALVVLGVFLPVITEFLSAFNALRRGPLIFCWVLVAAAGLI